jgi:hypothetical protein
MDFPAQVLPASTRSLVAETPPAPPGTFFVLAAEGGYAVPPRACMLLFGRDRDEVDVPVGTDDPHVSRKHGVLTCTGREWWLRNTGGLPIELSGSPMLLTGHERRLDPGYTPLVINSSKHRSHLVEVRLTDGGDGGAASATDAETTPPQDVYSLNPEELLVLTALAQRYLGQDPYPQSLTWQQAADALNQNPVTAAASGAGEWSDRAVERKVGQVRQRLGIPGTTRKEVGEPVGNMLNHNLIQALLKTTALWPAHLRLLGDVSDGEDAD